MPNPEISQQAREMLAAEYEIANMPSIAAEVRAGTNTVGYIALRAIESALTRQPSDGYMRGRDDAIVAALAAWPRAHTYASENADLYRAQDAVRDRIVSAIRKLGGGE